MAKIKFHRDFRFIIPLFLFISAFHSVPAKPGFSELQFNPHWYRSFDSTSDIIPSKGQLLFNWKFGDSERRPDSFYVGIDTLWALPQDMNADTNQDWDLQVCPNGFCMNGLKAGVHGADAPDHFGDTTYETEHHFQFFPAISTANFRFTGPTGALFGAMMFCRSLSTGISDTVLAFGSWGLVWDTLNPPPVRPVAGYLPRLSDFSVNGNTVKYLKSGSKIRTGHSGNGSLQKIWTVEPNSGGISFSFSKTATEKRVKIYGLNGSQIWSSSSIPAAQSRLLWNQASDFSGGKTNVFLCRLTVGGKEMWEKVTLLP